MSTPFTTRRPPYCFTSPRVWIRNAPGPAPAAGRGGGAAFLLRRTGASDSTEPEEKGEVSRGAKAVMVSFMGRVDTVESGADSGEAESPSKSGWSGFPASDFFFGAL